MKKCPYCGKQYPDEALICAIDGTELPSVRPTTRALGCCMSVQTEITQKDVKAFVRYVAIGSQAGRSFYKLFVFSSAVMGGILGVAPFVTGGRLQVVSLAAGFFVGFFWLVIIGRIQSRIMRPAKESYALGPRTVSFNDAGIRETSQKHELFFRWRSVCSSEFAGEYIFVMADQKFGIIVPIRAFSSDAERDQFLADIQSYSATDTHEPAS